MAYTVNRNRAGIQQVYGASATDDAATILAKLITVDGASSGLDADKLDGQEGSYYLPATSYTANDVLTKLKTVDGASSLLDADLLDGQEAAAFAASAHNHSGVYSEVGHTHSYIADEATGAHYSYGTSWGTAAGYLALGVKRVGNVCFLSGQVARSVTTSSVVTIATLDAGYRPTLGTHVIWTWAYHSSNYYAVALTVATNGVITLTTSISATIGNLYFDGLFFPLN